MATQSRLGGKLPINAAERGQPVIWKSFTTKSVAVPCEELVFQSLSSSTVEHNKNQRKTRKCLYDLGVCIKQAVGINITDTIIVTWTKARNFKATEPCLMSYM